MSRQTVCGRAWNGQTLTSWRSEWNCEREQGKECYKLSCKLKMDSISSQSYSNHNSLTLWSAIFIVYICMNTVHCYCYIRTNATTAPVLLLFLWKRGNLVVFTIHMNSSHITVLVSDCVPVFAAWGQPSRWSKQWWEQKPGGLNTFVTTDLCESTPATLIIPYLFTG